jgi:spore germination protein YaaH
MKNLFKSIFFLSLFSVFLLCPAGAFSEGGLPLEKIFYLASYNAEAGVVSVNQNWQEIDILAPQMHTVTFVGNSAKIVGGFGPKLKKAIKDHNLKVMPLVANAGFSQSLMHKLLLSEYEQDRVITGLVYLAKRDKYIGWQFDFENISYLDKNLYSAFVERTSKAFKKNNLVLSVAVISRTTDYEDTNAFKNWGGVYDYQRLSQSADFLSLMAYDDPNSVGPVASIDFVNKALNYVKDKIPANKLSLGVPLYYWKWNADSNTKIGSGLFKNVALIIKNFQHTMNFDESLGASCLSYVYNNKNYKIWFEDKKSFEAKLDIIKNNNLRGFSAWLLGGEDPDIWKTLSQSH